MATLVLAASDLPSGFRRGDPITVVPDDHPFSPLELLPPAQGGIFARVVITDVTVEQVKSRIGPLFEDAQPGDPEFDAPDPEDRRIRRLKRRFSVAVGNLPLAVRQELNQNGVYTTNLSAVRIYIRRLRWDRNIGDAVDDGEEFAA